MSLSSQGESNPRIAIVGAGAAGLSTAIALKRRLGFQDFVIYEKANDIGGTWRDNIYPGCASDTHMAYYSLSTDLHNWKVSHGSREVILDYWMSLAKKYDLYPSILFNHEVISVQWDSTENLYRIISENASIAKRTESTAQMVISAFNFLGIPKFPAIPGIGTFTGETFHSGRWKADLDLTGKRIGVIGSASSAAQFVPFIAKYPAVHVTQFCRTPNWFFPPMYEIYSPLRRWFLGKIPFLMRLHRWKVSLQLELMLSTVKYIPFVRRKVTETLTSYMLRTAPEKYHDKLIPNFPIGCKRVVFDTHYLETLHQSNVILNWDGIERIDENGIVTTTGENIPLDVLIFATGFATDDYPLSVKGVNHKSIQQYNEEHQGPAAYLGTTVPGFPNFFLVSGPNAITGASFMFSIEVQINYIIQLIKPILQKKILAVEVKHEPTEAYNEKIHADFEKSPFVHCQSTYRYRGTGKVINAFPGLAYTMWLRLRKPNWDHYTTVANDNYSEPRDGRFWSAFKFLLLFSSTLVVLALGSLYLYPHSKFPGRPWPVVYNVADRNWGI